ncbi:TonB-linked outer membrane protein, SusC/RagA family [Segatella oris F0302]|uniref:TonB-linked outer membrane protein, SusC/RagA family n=1 Tax=Segatella oris F0302 TaxID=649760 RepID=D1QR03_9BACT|nr:TonB-dependent receptor [Segatella oris]EFB32254.1 TonB-linked outer membrane protein, SusC/RagA family [Segatella oris F0302]
MKKLFILFWMSCCIVFNALAQEQLNISGTVTDAAGEALIGVSVTVKDAKGLGTITNIDGKYNIKIQQYQTLVFSYIGYKPVSVLVKGDKKVIDVQMSEEKTNAIDEVVVTGLGTQKKLTVTGAITNVDVSQMKQFPSSNFTNALAGNVPGIIAMQSSGQPGKSTSRFWVRGISTFGASASAMILVDGFERNNIDDLNIEDIESFSVLKDASATAIYGSKGANGVILITTKHGKAGKININVKGEASYNTRTITPKFIDAPTYANLLNEARVTRNLAPQYQPEELALIRSGLDPDFYPNVDWSKLLLKNGAMSYRADLSMSGGGNTARYFVSLSYVEDQGMYNTDETLRKKYDTNANYKRWNYRMNVDIDVTPTTIIKLGVSGNLNKRNSPGLGDQYLWSELFGFNALSSPVLYSNGYVPAYGNNVHQMNPWVSSTRTGYNEEWDNNIQTNVTVEQKLDFITKGLSFTGRFGYDTYNSNHIYYRLWPAMYRANSRDSQGNIIWDKLFEETSMSQTSGGDGSRHEFLEALLRWDRTFDKLHNFSAVSRFTQDERIQTRNIGTDIKNSVSKRNQGLAGQLTYNYALRYFIDFNFGYNGSENFADHHRYGFFPAFSLAWNVAEEPLVKQALPWLNMFKLRYSWGKVGNDNMGRFPYLYTLDYTPNIGYNWGSNLSSGTIPGIHYTQMASPNVTWEVARKTDFGFDFVAFDNKFSLTMDYFHEKRTGIFIQRMFLPDITGLESYPWANVGAVKSKGFDGNFQYKDHIGEVNWTVRGNITYSKNTILERDEENNVYAYQYGKGYRVNQQRGLIALGLFRDYDDIRNSPKQSWGTVQPGDIKYKDVNGDGIVDDGDRVAIGATDTPSLIYGLGASVSWRGFDLNLHFQGAGKYTFLINSGAVNAFRDGRWGNILQGITDNRWISSDISGTKETENPNAPYPRLSYGYNLNNQQSSSFWLRNGRFLRLKNLDIGYTLPKPMVNTIHLESVRIYISGQNLITWSPFKLWDPELDSRQRGQIYPITRSFTAGIQISL